jgi:SagB-type dehydrogenase family enzyme
LDSWRNWSPAASFFHFSTKDAHAPIDRQASAQKLRRRARANRMPTPVKSYPKSPQIDLPAATTTGDFERVLLERRTWREFSRRPVDLQQLGTLMGLSFGAQSWLDMPGIGRTVLKTSPSGGSRHPIEAYVLAVRVKGLDRGLYHYNAATHRLELLHPRASASQLVGYLNGQSWFRDASVLVLMTAIFGRTQWKYPASRAYRVVLADAGHVCQTFCLVATSLGLGPFCTMALADSKIEADLGIDGVSESIVYTAGVGTRPKGADQPTFLRAFGQVRANPFF